MRSSCRTLYASGQLWDPGCSHLSHRAGHSHSLDAPVNHRRLRVLRTVPRKLERSGNGETDGRGDPCVGTLGWFLCGFWGLLS